MMKCEWCHKNSGVFFKYQVIGKVSGWCRKCETVFQGDDWLKGTHLSPQV